MKKNSTSCVLLTGLMASAYAAGSPRTSTSSVETRLAIAELMKNGGKSPERTSWYSARGGKKKIVGGGPGARRSLFSPPRHHHRTREEKNNNHHHPTPHPHHL